MRSTVEMELGPSSGPVDVRTARRVSVRARRRCLLAAAAVSLSMLWGTRASSAEPLGPRDAPVAEALFQSGKEAMARGDLATACARLAESHRLDPAIGTLLNLAVCRERSGKIAAALEHLVSAREDLPPDDFRVPFVTEQIAKLEARVPHLVLELRDAAPASVVILQTPSLRRPRSRQILRDGHRRRWADRQRIDHRSRLLDRRSRHFRPTGDPVHAGSRARRRSSSRDRTRLFVRRASRARRSALTPSLFLPDDDPRGRARHGRSRRRRRARLRAARGRDVRRCSATDRHLDRGMRRRVRVRFRRLDRPALGRTPRPGRRERRSPERARRVRRRTRPARRGLRRVPVPHAPRMGRDVAVVANGHRHRVELPQPGPELESLALHPHACDERTLRPPLGDTREARLPRHLSIYRRSGG